MGGLQGIVSVCSRSAFTLQLRGVSGGADAQLCLFSLASLAPVQTLSSLHKKRRRRPWDGRGLCPTCGRCRTPRRRNYAPSRQASLASKNTKCSIEGSDPMSVKRFESPSPAPAGSRILIQYKPYNRSRPTGSESGVVADVFAYLDLSIRQARRAR